MKAPVDTQCTDALIRAEFVKDGGQSFAASSFEEFVCIYESHPCVLGAVQPSAFAVDMLLHLWILSFLVVILEGKGRSWNTEIFEARERRVGPVVHDIEAPDAMMVIVVGEELGKIAQLVPVCYAESYVFLRICRSRFDFGTVTEGVR